MPSLISTPSTPSRVPCLDRARADNSTQYAVGTPPPTTSRARPPQRVERVSMPDAEFGRRWLYLAHDSTFDAQHCFHMEVRWNSCPGNVAVRAHTCDVTRAHQATW
jgi:hypothetical protein